VSGPSRQPPSPSSPRRPVRVISQFDSPGGFRPQSDPYRGLTLEPTTEQVLVAGPPRGDDYLRRYQSKVAAEVAVGGWLNNGRWQGEPETGLLAHVPDSRSRPEVLLSQPSPALGPAAFSPTAGWRGEGETGLARPRYTVRAGLVVPAGPLQSPSPLAARGSSFSPSSWLTDRQELLQAGARRPVSQEEEAVVITLDNVDSWLRQRPDRPDTFAVNVATVINTRGAQSLV